LESGIADIPVVLKQRADVDRLAAPEVAMYRPIEGELQRPAVERPGFAVSGVRRLVVEPWDGHVTDSAASLDDMVGGVYLMRPASGTLSAYQGGSVAVSAIVSCSRIAIRARPGRGAGKAIPGDIWAGDVATFWCLVCFELN
jgi:hypothetical protein